MIKLLGVFIALTIFTLSITGLWFCFDDKLSELVDYPELGKLPWYNVWAALTFITLVCRRHDVFGNNLPKKTSS